MVVLVVGRRVVVTLTRDGGGVSGVLVGGGVGAMVVLLDRLEKVEKRQEDMEINMIENIKEKVIESIQEDEGRRNKNKNIVIFNILEAEGENEREKKD